MNKSTVLIIAVIYFASIVFISIFGMTSVVYNTVIPVTEISCLNESDKNTEVEYSGDKKLIKIKFESVGNVENLTGTMVQLNWRVLPDNASNKNVKFIYDQNTTRAEFIKDEGGNELGLILFLGKAVLNVRIMSTDGSRVYEDVVVWAY